MTLPNNPAPAKLTQTERDELAAIEHNKKTHPHLANDDYFQCAEHSYTIRDFLSGAKYGREDADIVNAELRKLGISLLEETIQLKASLETAVAALEFYGDETNWEDHYYGAGEEPGDIQMAIDLDDVEYKYDEGEITWSCGGKRAREFLGKLREAGP